MRQISATLLKALAKLRYYYWQVCVFFIAKYQGIDIGKNCKFYGLPIMRRVPNSKIVIGDNVVICSHSSYNVIGINHPTIIRTLTEGSTIKIGNDTGISGASICAADDITIGNEVLIGANVSIFDTDFHAREPLNRRYNTTFEDIGVKQVQIDDNVFIGTNAIICKGVRIKTNSIIGAGSVVTKNIDIGKIAAGNPAKEITDV